MSVRWKTCLGVWKVTGGRFRDHLKTMSQVGTSCDNQLYLLWQTFLDDRKQPLVSGVIIWKHYVSVEQVMEALWLCREDRTLKRKRKEMCGTPSPLSMTLHFSLISRGGAGSILSGTEAAAAAAEAQNCGQNL